MIKIGDKIVGTTSPIFIIAEAGSNHNGSIEMAYQLIDAATQAGVDAIKFQTFKAEHIYPRTGAKVEYLKELGLNEPLYDIIKKAEMPKHWLPLLSLYCKKKGIIFLSTPFDEASANALNPYVDAFKIASYEITHLPLIRHIARKQKPIILSTGTATIEEVKKAVEAIRAEKNEDIIVMQCTAKYPAPNESLNLNAIKTLRKELNLMTGLSDHSENPVVAPIAATALGAVIIEKHFTLDHKLPGADHKFALEPVGLKLMVQAVREEEKALGTGIKKPHKVEEELCNYKRAVFSLTDIKAGEAITKINTRILRKPGIPDEGISPENYDLIIGKLASCDIPQFTLIKKEMIP